MISYPLHKKSHCQIFVNLIIGFKKVSVVSQRFIDLYYTILYRIYRSVLTFLKKYEFRIHGARLSHEKKHIMIS